MAHPDVNPGAPVTSFEREKPFLCMRGDGMLVMGNTLTISQSHAQSDPTLHLMRYSGDPNATLQERMIMLQGYEKAVGGSVKEALEAGKGVVRKLRLGK